MVDDFSSLLWLLQHPEDTTPGMHSRIRRLMLRIDTLSQADLPDARLVFSGQRIEWGMLSDTWELPWKEGLHLWAKRVNGRFETFTGRVSDFGTITYPGLERKPAEQENRPDAATLRMVMEQIESELASQQTILANRQRMGMNDNALHAGAITMLEDLDAWCLQQLDTMEDSL